MELVLASTSPWRLKMLKQAGIPVRGVSPGVTEESDETDPALLVQILADRKAFAVFEREPAVWVLGADQVVHAEGEVHGKPPSSEAHLQGLLAMRGRAHDLVTGFSLVGPGFVERGVDITTMHVRGDLTEAEIRAYVATGEGTHCAGGYALEGHGSFLFERVEGDFFNVLGLPLLRVQDILRRRGWRYGDTAP